MHAGAKTEDPVPVKDEFRIADEVIAAARNWKTMYIEGHLRCLPTWSCGQSIIHIAERQIDVTMIESALLAHLMQRHGWTREAVGDG